MYFNSINTHWRYKNVGWVGFGVRQCAVNGGSEILASDWPSQFDFDQWPQLYILVPTLVLDTTSRGNCSQMNFLGSMLIVEMFMFSIFRRRKI